MSHPARYWNPDKSNKFSIAMVGFVDDSNGQVNSFDSNDTKGDLQNLLAKATSNATVWSQLVDATGGALEISKCSYHVLYWKFSCQGAPVLVNVDSETQPVQVPAASSGNIQTLEYLPPTVAHKTLGHDKEPAGLQKAQFRTLKKKSDQITDFLTSSQLT